MLLLLLSLSATGAAASVSAAVDEAGAAGAVNDAGDGRECDDGDGSAMAPGSSRNCFQTPVMNAFAYSQSDLTLVMSS